MGANQPPIWAENVKSPFKNVEVEVPTKQMKILRKNPISELQEQCTKRKWPMPTYNLVHEEGPPHLRRFQFEVKVNQKWFRPEGTLGTKQTAKAEAADNALNVLNL